MTYANSTPTSQAIFGEKLQREALFPVLDDHNITSIFPEYSWQKIEMSFTHLHDYTFV